MKLQTQLSHTTPNPNPKSIAGFTLVELSIVLVILGLLVGGVLAGQSLIRAAELRAVSSEFQKYQTALGTFKDKYFAVPGDMNNAVRYWGAQAGGTADGVDAACVALTDAATGTATCNGDGDGIVEYYVPHEMYRAWQHLANAGLVEGNFTGVTGAGGVRTSVIGSNVTRSKLGNAGWNWGNFDANFGGDVNRFPMSGNVLQFGGNWPLDTTWAPIVKAEEAYNIDMKLDDGKPQTGKVLAYKYAYQVNCAVSTNDAYNLANTNVGCGLWFITGY